MNTKNNFATITLTSAICLLPIILSFIVYKNLPKQIAIHWDNTGTPNTFVPRAIAAFGLPFLFLSINLLSKLRLYNDPKRANNEHPKAIQAFTAWLPPLLSLTVVPAILSIAIGASVSIRIIETGIVGMTLIFCGNYLPKCRQNYTIGIKLPWTLHDTDNWNKTHRMAGYLWIIGGMTRIIGTFISAKRTFGGVSLTILIIIPLIVAPTIYSYALYKKTERGNSNAEN